MNESYRNFGSMTFVPREWEAVKEEGRIRVAIYGKGQHYSKAAS